tara:strand:+ start:1677 stop:2402 length:726 start_codon:yes stop_codon:yes gene_type:complete
MARKKDYTREAVMTSVEELTPHPQNYREHPQDQIAHIVRSIEEHGFYRNVVVAKDNTILAGHGVVQAAQQLGMKEIPVVKLNIKADTTQALKLLAADNYIQHRSLDDDRKLTDLLKQISQEDDLLGTGFDEAALAAYVMISRPIEEIETIDAALEWAELGMPEFTGVDQIDEFRKEVRAIIIFPDESERAKFVDKQLQNDKEFRVDVAGDRHNWSCRYPASKSKDHREPLKDLKFISEHDE